jgi:hypothetical protein
MAKTDLKQNNQNEMSKGQQWEMLFPMLNAVLMEMKVLSKGKPNDPLNEFKAKSVNKILTKIIELLSGEATIEFLELLDEDTLPKNSDTVFMLVQFKSAMDQFKSKYYTFKGSIWDWRI